MARYSAPQQADFSDGAQQAAFSDGAQHDDVSDGASQHDDVTDGASQHDDVSDDAQQAACLGAAQQAAAAGARSRAAGCARIGRVSSWMSFIAVLWLLMACSCTGSHVLSRTVDERRAGRTHECAVHALRAILSRRGPVA
jgi:hypothetical protein